MRDVWGGRVALFLIGVNGRFRCGLGPPMPRMKIKEVASLEREGQWSVGSASVKVERMVRSVLKS